MAGSSIKSGKHLVLITPSFPENDKDASSLSWLSGYVLGLAEEIGPDNISILSIDEPIREGWFKWNGIDVYSAGGKSRKGLFEFLTNRKISSTFNSIRKKYPDITIHSCWLTEATFIGEKFCAKYGYNQVASIFGQDVLPSNSYLQKINLSSLKVIANSEFSASIYQSSTGKVADAIIPIGINPNLFHTSGTLEKKYDLISIGSLYEIKQYHLVVRLIEQLRISFPQIKAAIAGDGPNKTILQKQINEAGLQGQIKLLGPIPNAEIINLLKQSKIFVHPSRYETSSHAILEATYAGIPVVCLKVGYFPVPGYIHQCDNYASMFEKISGLLSKGVRLPPAEVPLIAESIRNYRKIYQL